MEIAGEDDEEDKVRQTPGTPEEMTDKDVVVPKIVVEDRTEERNDKMDESEERVEEKEQKEPVVKDVTKPLDKG